MAETADMTRAAAAAPDAAARGAADPGAPRRAAIPDAPPPAAATQTPFRGGGFRPERRRWAGIAVFVLLIALIEAGTRLGWISNLTLPRPSAVFATLVQLAESGFLFKHLLPSLSRFAVGSAIGVSLGVSVGLAVGLFTYARAGIAPLLAALFPIPKIALLPVFLIWFGIGEQSKYALIAFGTFTPTAVAAYAAVDNVDRGLIRMGQSFGLSWTSIVAKIVLPGAMPGILSGLRISLSIAIILLVAAEMMGAEYGIGAYINEAGAIFDLERLFAGVIILSIMGVCVSAAVAAVERRLLRWRG